MISRCKSNSAVATAYFYFDFGDVEKRSCDYLIRSLIKQLSSKCKTMPKMLQAVYCDCRDHDKQPRIDDLLKILLDILKGFRHSYIIIDALDECRDREEELLPSLRKIIDWKLSNVHILVTSRKEKDIKDCLEPLISEELCLQTSLEADIRIHVHETLQHDRIMQRWPAQLHGEIEEALTKKSDGM